ncbi:MAG: peptide-methionine (S)-S-oxide reductase MsrA [Bacteroidales bacterium]|jgi:peptide-methionine (S)-S-oxide reductase
MENSGNQTATFGTGCFWCSEAIFMRLNGVKSVTSGYSGGTKENPTYDEVCTGETVHAEVVQVVFDPGVISFKELLEVFWKTHDPTTLNRQGDDVGTQYRSVVFYHNLEQEQLARAYMEALEQAGIWERPIVTEIAPFTIFYPSEAYHEDYYSKNPGNGYCNLVITPKIEKFKKVFSDKLK